MAVQPARTIWKFEISEEAMPVLMRVILAALQGMAEEEIDGWVRSELDELARQLNHAYYG